MPVAAALHITLSLTLLVVANIVNLGTVLNATIATAVPAASSWDLEQPRTFSALRSSLRASTASALPFEPSHSGLETSSSLTHFLSCSSPLDLLASWESMLLGASFLDICLLEGA
ncbi:hypothetical protein ACFX13_027405 [Malus domestica]